MLASFWKTIALLAALLLQDASAQQFLGDVIPNVTYPGVPGSELVYFRVKDPAGKNNNLTLVNYQSLGSNGKRIVPSKIKRAVIIVHGLNRDAGTYMSNMLSALSQLTTDSNINFDSVVINAPSFPNGDDKNASYPYWDYPPGAKKKASGGAQSWTNLLVWKGSQWAGGGTNQYPVKNTNVSSYDVLDQLIQYYSDKSIFPNVNQVVIAGHSLGAQTVQRYAAVGKPLSSMGVTVPVTYWIANPNSLVWLNSSRPLSTASCAGYDDWRDGLSSYADYPSLYNTGLVASGTSAVLANYQSKNKAYARGTLDMGDDSSGCAPFTTGSNRHERFYYFINWWTPTCEAPTSGSGHCDTIDLVPMGHDGGGMMASSAGLARLFSDNFYGDGKRSYDFGYPRIQANVDDPYPNPAYNETSDDSQKTVYAGNMTFAGCYTDSGTRTLATMVYDSPSNTIEKCTTACANAGYTIAGMEYGSQCWCDNQLGPYTQKALDLGCSQACPGNASETCGQSNRLSVYSNGVPTSRAAPSNPEVVGNYYFSGCHNESTSGHALSGPSYSDGKNMTLESCAAFCNGYKYFGIEYAAECYCGSYFGAGSAIVSDNTCSMLCTGNSLELCGGPGALSVYQLNSDAPVSTIVQGSTTAAPVASNTGVSASGLPSASLCPATNGQTVADSNNATYLVGCSSDTSIGSYASSQAVNSYFDCMVACDNAASTNCVAFTYVGGTNGQGSGTCYLKNSQGSFSAGASNLVSGFKSSSGSVNTVTSTTSSAAPAATTYANGSTPSVGGVTYGIEIDVTYQGIHVSSSLPQKRAAVVVGDCLNACAQNSACVGTAFDGSACTLYGSIDTSTKSSAPGTTFATVKSRSTATSTSSSSTGIPSASLCPSTNGQTVKGYVVSCSSDTNIGSYANAQAANSYLECMSACDAAASTGCQAWTYVGGTNGLGSGACYLKNSKGSFTPTGSNYVAGMAASQPSSSSSSLLSSTQSGSASSSVAVSSSSVSSTTSSAATASASSNLCPTVDSQDVTDSNGKIYTIKCSSDTTIGSFANAQAVNTYADCMTACDSTTGCVAFTYVGGANGQGSGACYLKNALGSASPAGGNNYISGFLKQTVTSSSSTVTSALSSSASSNSASSSSVSSSSVSSSTVSSSTGVPSASLCPQANGQTITDSNGNLYNVTCSADNSVGSYTNAQASTSYLDCMAACDAAASSGCQGFTYVGGANGLNSGTCWLKQSMADYPASSNNVISAVKVAKSNVLSSVSSSSASSSSASSSSVSSSSVSSSSSSASQSSSSASQSSSSSTDLSSSASQSSSSSTIASSSASQTSGSSTAPSSSSSQSSTSASQTTSSSIASSSSASQSSSSSSDSSSSASQSSSSASQTSSSSVISSSSASQTSSSSVASSTSISATQSSSSSIVSSTSSSQTISSSSSIVSSTSASQTSSSSATTLSTLTSSSTSSTSSALSLPTGFSSYGCFIDGNPRALAYSAGSKSDNTPYKCASTCQSLGYKYAGTEYGSECWCANAAPTSSTKATDCNMACSGDKTQTCGAGNRLSVYVDNTWTQKFSARPSYGSWNLMACYTDGSNGRILPQTMSMTGGSNNATIANCLDACAKSGLRVCGAEYYQECYGGSVAPSASLIAGSDPLTSGCNYPCTGNKTEACGGSNKILVYINNGTMPSRR
ncbi:WSC-domain-containing protein [Aureobasidium pullulans]|nr:WSC-domain-containing protein [Aureobasidium pullulans]